VGGRGRGWERNPRAVRRHRAVGRHAFLPFFCRVSAVLPRQRDVGRPTAGPRAAAEVRKHAGQPMRRARAGAAGRLAAARL